MPVSGRRSPPVELFFLEPEVGKCYVVGTAQPNDAGKLLSTDAKYLGRFMGVGALDDDAPRPGGYLGAINNGVYTFENGVVNYFQAASRIAVKELRRADRSSKMFLKAYFSAPGAVFFREVADCTDPIAVRAVAGDLARAEMAGFPGARDEGKEAPAAGPVRKLPTAVGRNIMSFLGKPEGTRVEKAQTTKEALAKMRKTVKEKLGGKRKKRITLRRRRR